MEQLECGRVINLTSGPRAESGPSYRYRMKRTQRASGPNDWYIGLRRHEQKSPDPGGGMRDQKRLYLDKAKMRMEEKENGHAS